MKETKKADMMEAKQIATKDVQGVPQKHQMSYPTWMILVGLVFAFVILKTFIYIKDDKRHGK